jgi:hypothetical protein
MPISYDAQLYDQVLGLTRRGVPVLMVRLEWDPDRRKKRPPVTFGNAKHWQHAEVIGPSDIEAVIRLGANAYLYRLPDDLYVIDTDNPIATDWATSLLGAPAVVTPHGAHWLVASDTDPGTPLDAPGGIDTAPRQLYGPGSHYTIDGAEVSYEGSVPVTGLALPWAPRAAKPAAPTAPAASSPVSDFFAGPPITREQASATVSDLLEAIATGPESGSVARLGIMKAGLYLGGIAHAGWFSPQQASQAITDACARRWGQASDEDERWAAQALSDGAAKPLRTTLGRSPGKAGRPARPLTTLEPAVWEARPVLALIRDAAWSARLSPDALLHTILARLSAMRSHTTVIDSGIDIASLNYFAALVGPSGAGKSRAITVATALLPAHEDFPSWPLGSGEGLIEAFMGTIETLHPETGKVVKQRTQVRHNALFSLDEGQALTRMLERAGATVGPILRSAWSGAEVGQANASDERKRKLPAASYSLGMVAGYQEETILSLLADSSTGMAQRFGYAAAVDPQAPRERARRSREALPVVVPTPSHYELAYSAPTVLTVPEAVTADIDERLWRVQTGYLELPVLDSQYDVTRLKVSGLLALLEGRTEVAMEDWQLSEQLWVTSAAVRDELVERGQEADESRREAGNLSYAHRQAMAETVKADAPIAVERIARKLTEHVRGQIDSVRIGEVRHKLASRDRGYCAAALAYAEARGWVVSDGSYVKPGDVEGMGS